MRVKTNPSTSKWPIVLAEAALIGCFLWCYPGQPDFGGSNRVGQPDTLIAGIVGVGMGKNVPPQASVPMRRWSLRSQSAGLQPDRFCIFLTTGCMASLIDLSQRVGGFKMQVPLRICRYLLRPANLSRLLGLCVEIDTTAAGERLATGLIRPSSIKHATVARSPGNHRVSDTAMPGAVFRKHPISAGPWPEE